MVFESSISAVSKEIRYIWKLYSYYRNYARDRIVEAFYNRLPTTEGTLNSELENEIETTLISTGSKFNAFNRSVGNLARFSTAMLVLLFPISALFVFAQSTFVPDWVSLVILYIAAIIMGVSLLGIILADFGILYYAGALMWFGLRQLRGNLGEPRSSIESSYECYSDSENITVYSGNFTSFIRAIYYSIGLCVIGFSILLWPIAISVGQEAASLYNFENIPQIPFGEVASTIPQSLDAILPFDILYFFTLKGIASLILIISILLTFSIFLNLKRILRHAERSRIELSDIETYSAWQEIKRSYVILEISLFYLLEGKLQDQFQDIKGSVIASGWELLVSIVVSAFFLFIFTSA